MVTCDQEAHVALFPCLKAETEGDLKQQKTIVLRLILALRLPHANHLARQASLAGCAPVA